MVQIKLVNDMASSLEWKHRIRKNSYYLRSSWILNSIKPLTFSKIDGQIVKFDCNTTGELAELISRKNLFQRIPTSSKFYVQRALDLGDSTIIEIYGQEHPDTLTPKAQIFANWIEMVCVLAESLSNDREKIKKKLQIKENRRTVLDLTIGKDFYYLRTNIKQISIPKGIQIDDIFISRYQKCGLNELENVCFIDGEIHKRIEKSVKWLFESRTEPLLKSAIVKTAISMESLLIFDDNESLANSLSERIALILTDDSDLRKKISQHVKKFYNARSGIVHGGKKKLKHVSPNLLEGIDRILILLYLIIIHNIEKWNTDEKLKIWLENEKFGIPDSNKTVPFSKNYITNAMKKIEKI